MNKPRFNAQRLRDGWAVMDTHLFRYVSYGWLKKRAIQEAQNLNEAHEIQHNNFINSAIYEHSI